MEDRQTQAILLDNFNELEQSYRKDVSESLATVKANTEKIQFNQQLYYNEKQDAKDVKHYYSSVANIGDSNNLFAYYHELVKRTHQQRIPYFISKDQFLYTWVDMQPDGSVKSIYSGEHKDPKTIIEEDFETIRKKYDEFLGLLKNKKHLLDELHKKMANIESSIKFNTEHIVPQSWFGGKEPMKGDLHHLFVCQPECNTARSNFPYDDFDFYVPESSEEVIQNHCGVANEGKFEPENGKGAAARAMLYFLLRYPKAIRKPFLQQIDLGLLISWNHQFKVTIHEKHRNRAIYRIQGNRNPFIDFPELAEKIRFQIY
ncbi:endonuclease [Bacillus sp. FJAT-49705]|uniref:Endonuclease n=1 Tax=Cytobacillus citreus TaxID=2833586 RepID=A0ABS5NXQ0_9BACI|nr:endonuclease [Cytobacillus citreus]MBS4192598.1 endonuclease [Cytobacillus citreus]